MKTSLQIIVVTIILALGVGCASVGYEQADATSSSLQAAAQSIDDTLLPLSAVLVALDDLVTAPGEDLTTQFEIYSSAVSQLEESVKSVNMHASQMQTQGDAYFQNWEAELANIQSNDIQSRSRDRKQAMAKQFREVSDGYARTRDELTPFVSDLIDIRTALGTDLTEGGLNSLNGLLKTANREAASLRKSMIQLSAAFKDIGVSLSPAVPSA